MFARTKRLTLRPAWPEEAPALAAAIGHEAVVMRLSHAPWPYRVTDAEAFLRKERRASEPSFLIVAPDHAAPCIFGGIGLRLEGDYHELGYWLTPAAWGRGIATEAGRAVIEIARHALPIARLRARHHLDNPASARVLAKLGFRPTGQVEAVWSKARRAMVDTALTEIDLTACTKAMAIAA